MISYKESCLRPIRGFIRSAGALCLTLCLTMPPALAGYAADDVLVGPDLSSGVSRPDPALSGSSAGSASGSVSGSPSGSVSDSASGSSAASVSDSASGSSAASPAGSASAPVLGDADYNGGIEMLGSSSTLTVDNTLDEYEWVKTNMAGRFYPYVIDHAEGNPNVIHFLYEYGHDAASPETFSYTEEEKSADIPLLMQWDYRWGFPWYGGGPAGLTACAPTCMTMIGLGLTKDESYTVPAMCKYSEDSGYWVDGQGTSWSLVTNAFPNDPIVCQSLSVDEGSIAYALQQGMPVLINVGVGKFSAVGHFMVLTGLDADGNFILNDPNNLENSRKTWPWSELSGEIQAAWCYSLSS